LSRPLAFELRPHRDDRGFEPCRRSAEHGFTLIELMIVITIIGLASAAVVWALPDPRGRLLDEATRFAARTRAAQQSAVVDARPVSVWVSGGGYGFDERTHGKWVPVAEKPLRVTSWGKGTRAVVTDTGGRQRIMFDTTGLADRPLDVRLKRDAEEVSVRIAPDGSVKVGG
jgi:general secretion pathway protein H